MSNYLSHAQKQALVLTLIKAGAPTNDAHMAIDLACHAVDKAIQTFIDSLRAAPNVGVAKVGATVGGQIARARFDAMAKDLLDQINVKGGEITVVDLSKAEQAPAQ